MMSFHTTRRSARRTGSSLLVKLSQHGSTSIVLTRRRILERHARPLELMHERRVPDERRHDDDLDVAIRVEQPVDQAAPENVSGGHAAWNGNENVHAVLAVFTCSNSYGSETRPSST